MTASNKELINGNAFMSHFTRRASSPCSLSFPLAMSIPVNERSIPHTWNPCLAIHARCLPAPQPRSRAFDTRLRFSDLIEDATNSSGSSGLYSLLGSIWSQQFIEVSSQSVSDRLFRLLLRGLNHFSASAFGLVSHGLLTSHVCRSGCGEGKV